MNEQEEKKIRAPRAKHSKAGSVIVRPRAGHAEAKTGARAPQAVMKVIGYPNGPGAQKCMHYVARVDEKDTKHLDETGEREKVVLEKADGKILSTKEEIDALYMTWKKDFDTQAKGGALGSRARHVAHLTFSAAGENNSSNQQKVLEAVRKTLDEKFKGKHDYVIGMHQDSKHPHVHVIINCNSLVKKRNLIAIKRGPKLRLNKPELLELRKDFARELSAQGLIHEATKRRAKDELSIPEQVKKQMEFLERRDKQNARSLAKAKPSLDVPRHQEFITQRLHAIKKGIDENTLPLSPDRAEAMKILNATSSKLSKEGKSMNANELTATMNFINGEVGKISKGMDEAKKMDGKDRNKREATMSDLGDDLSKRIKKAKEAIRESKELPKEKKIEALNTIRAHEKNLGLALGRARGR